MIEQRTFIKSFGHAIDGILFSIKDNQNLRIHIVVAVLVILVSIYFQVSPFEMSILGVLILLVISVEMVNTAIEEIANLVKREHSQEAKIAKDVAAGMVLVTTIGSVIVGVLIFTPYVLAIF